MLGASTVLARDAAPVREFRKVNPCPATGQVRGACPGYEVDHIKPLCAGGADHPVNLQWLSVAEHKTKTRDDVRLCSKQRRPL